MRRAARHRRPAPHRQHPADTMREPLAPLRAERGRAAAEEPDPGLERQGVHDQERIHPASVDRRHEQVAASDGQPLAARRVHLEAERPEQHEPRQDGQEANQPGLRLGLTAEPASPSWTPPRAAPGPRATCGLRRCVSARRDRSGPPRSGVGLGVVGWRGAAGATSPSARLGLDGSIASDADSGTSSKSTARPGAPQVAIAGNVGGSSSSGWFGRWRQARMSRAGTMKSSDKLRDRQSIERPVRVAERFELRTGDPVPDEEHEEQVARPQALRRW